MHPSAIAALVPVHEYRQSSAGHSVAQRLASKQRVFIAGFQTERGFAMCMSHLLQYLRDGVTDQAVVIGIGFPGDGETIAEDRAGQAGHDPRF